jgi:hypothetical protein
MAGLQPAVKLEWLGWEIKQLRVGQQVTETAELISAAGKKTRAGEEIVEAGRSSTRMDSGRLKRHWLA